MNEQQNDEVQLWLGSDDVTEVIRSTNNDLEIYGDDRNIIPRLIGEIVDEQVKLEDLRHELQVNFSDINPVKLDEATEMIKTGVFSKINEILNTQSNPSKIVGVPMVGTAGDTATATPRPPKTEDAPIKPQMDQSAPFILHQHEEEEGIRPRAEEVVDFNSTVRPMFYRAPNSTLTREVGPSSSRPIKARLELGIQEEGKTKRVSASRTGPQGVRQVNYSELRTKLDDPFSAQTKVGGDKVPKKTSDQTSEANLKDLPL